MGEPIKTLKAAAGFILYFSPQHSSIKQMEELKGKFAAEVDLTFEFISESILKESLPLTQRNVTATKDRLNKVDCIDRLKIVDESANIAKKLA
jgi:hypothetical protein